MLTQQAPGVSQNNMTAKKILKVRKCFIFSMYVLSSLCDLYGYLYCFDQLLQLCY